MFGHTILVTGASGYIGSHTCVCLLQAGWRVIGIDNLANNVYYTCNTTPQHPTSGKKITEVGAPVHSHWHQQTTVAKLTN